MVLRRGGITEIAAISVIPPLPNTINWEEFTVKFFFKPPKSRIRALATHTPTLGRVAQGAWD